MQDILVAPLRWVVYAFLERTLEVRNGFSAAPKSHRRTQVVSSSLTRPAVVARYTDFQCNTLANREALYARPDGHYNASRLMTEAQRLDGLQVTVAEFVVVRHVTPTQACRLDGYLKFARTGVCE